jgi:hypothetical protein
MIPADTTRLEAVFRFICPSKPIKVNIPGEGAEFIKVNVLASGAEIDGVASLWYGEEIFLQGRTKKFYQIFVP